MTDKVSTVNFCGLWDVKLLRKETGAYNRNKVIYNLRNAVYHPYVNETEAQIAQNVTVKNSGRNFSLWDKFDGQHKSDILQLERISIGERINPAQKDELIKKGYSENFKSHYLNDKDFYATWNNETYAPFDISVMSPERVEEVAQRHFSAEI